MSFVSPQEIEDDSSRIESERYLCRCPSIVNKKFLPAYLLTFVNSLGASILMPVLPFIVMEYGAPEWVFGLLLSLYSTFQFIGAPLLGSMSDAFGRKPVLLVSHIGTLISWVVFIIALYVPDIGVWGLALPLYIVAFSRIIDGVTGGNVSVANAYVADITTRKEKAYIFGYLGGIGGIALTIGPGLGGFSASTSLGHTGTGLLAISISLITLLAIFRWLKESLPVEKRVKRARESVWTVINIPGRVNKVNPGNVIKVLFTTKLLFTAMMGCYIGAIALYLIDLFAFDEKQLGLFMLVVGLFLAFNQAFVSKRFIMKFGEFKTLIIGLSLSAFGLFSITLTENLYLFIGCYYFMNLGLSLSFPTFNAIIATHANENKKGEIMGISESIGSFSMATFPVLSAYAYSQLGESWFHITVLLPLAAIAIALVSIKRLGSASFD
jgi:DHA1 family tetracycline resistance protein-like MFS transporter